MLAALVAIALVAAVVAEHAPLDLAESAVVCGSRVAVVAELAALDVGHVAQEHDTRRTMPGSG